MIKVIIFDLGAVCFDIDWKKIDEDMNKKYGISTLITSNYGPKINEIYNKSQKGEAKMLDVFNEICKDKNLNPKEVTKYYKELYIKHKKVNKEVKNFINKLRNKFKVVCYTDTNDIHFQAHIEQDHLKSFDSSFTSFDIGKIKREKGAFDKIINDLKVKPEEIVFVDDHPKNIDNAKSIGIKAIQFENFDQMERELKKLGITV